MNRCEVCEEWGDLRSCAGCGIHFHPECEPGNGHDDRGESYCALCLPSGAKAFDLWLGERAR